VDLGGVRYSHILDPRTGQALTERRLVSVLGPAAVRTDALATAASVLGPDEGLALVARHPGYEARILVRSGARTEVFRTAGFPRGLSCAGRSASSDP
jgi:thiamine biosynthesis lipoprotein